MTRVVLYDCGRLMARAKSATPTGIDRVDLRYLDHFLTDPNTTVIGVAQKRDALAVYGDGDVRAIHGLLSKRWLDRQPVTRIEARTASRIYLRGKALGLGPKIVQALTGARFPPSLRRRLARLDGPVLYVNASHKGMTKPTLFAALRDDLGAARVFFVHDLIPIDFPEYVRPGHDAKHAVRMRIAAAQGDLCIFNSAYSRDRFAAFAARDGIAPPPGVILHIGVEPHFNQLPQAQGPTARPAFVTVGTVEPRKNLRVLLDAWDILRARGGVVPQLRVIGKRGWVTTANEGDFDRAAAMSPDVVMLDRVEDGRLMDELAQARGLLFPSFTEGWGMPLVEAAVMGLPAIASDIPAFHEAAQGCATLLDPNDPAAWADAVAAWATPDSPDRAAAIHRLAGFTPPDWQRHFAGLEAALADHACENRAARHVD